jgi:hypothetical protein
MIKDFKEINKQRLDIGRRPKPELVEASTSAWRKAKDLYEMAKLVGSHNYPFSHYYRATLDFQRQIDDKRSRVTKEPSQILYQEAGQGTG